MMTKLKNGSVNIVRTRIFHCRWNVQCAKVKNPYWTRIYFGKQTHSAHTHTHIRAQFLFWLFLSLIRPFLIPFHVDWVHHNKFPHQTIVQLNRPVWVCHKQICQHVDHRHDMNRGHVHCAHIWINQNHHVAHNAHINGMQLPNHHRTQPIQCKSKLMRWAYGMPSIQKQMLPPLIEQVRWDRTVCRVREQI